MELVTVIEGKFPTKLSFPFVLNLFLYPGLSLAIHKLNNNKATIPCPSSIQLVFYIASFRMVFPFQIFYPIASSSIKL